MAKISLRPGLLAIYKSKPFIVTAVHSSDLVQIRSLLDNETIQAEVGDFDFLGDLTNTTNEKIVEEIAYDDRLRDASPLEAELAYARYECIKKYCENEVGFDETISALGVSQGTFYTYKRKYEAGEPFHAFIPARRGRRAAQKLLDPEIEEIINSSIKTLLAKKKIKKKFTQAKVWRLVEKTCIGKCLSVPCQSSIRSRILELPIRTQIAAKYGSAAAAQATDPRPGEIITCRPLERVQMDHTKMDMFVCDELLRKPLGRPWLTVIVDLYTRVILGFYIALHSPSAISVAAAMTHAVLPKKDFLQHINRPNLRYTFFGCFDKIGLDNAAEFRSSIFVEACRKNDIHPEFRPIGKKHYGGHIERLIGTLMMGTVHFLPGNTASNVEDNKEYDSEKHSIMTLKELIRWFTGQVVEYNNRVHRKIKCTPTQKWDQYYSSPQLQSTGGPNLIANPVRFKMSFFPGGRRKVSSKGLLLAGSYYWDNVMAASVGRRVEFKYDPSWTSYIWVYLNGDYHKIGRLDLSQPGGTFEEERIARKRNSVRPGSLGDTSIVAAMSEDENIEKESARLTKAQKLKNETIREYRESHFARNHLEIASVDRSKKIKSILTSGKPESFKKGR